MNKSEERTVSHARFAALMRGVLLGGASTIALGALSTPSFAQDAGGDGDEIIVTGIRGSLQRAMDIKRDSNGVVDAISAEDIGRMPDTNLAESLQRITGVSIDRVAGEGSTVTARGFGPGFNLVTLNGRAMPTADANFIGGGVDEFGTFTSRSFDFSNLASEGVTGLDVYKTGNSLVPTGGIGATINVRTFRPLDNPGTRGTLGVKGMYDTSVESGDEFTPEVTGLYSWSNPSETFGISLFGSYQRRDSAAVGAAHNDWNVERGSAFLDPNNGRVRADNPATPLVNEATIITNAPTANQLVVYPNNSDYYFSEFTRERVNGQLTAQFRPMDSLTLTGDIYYAQNESDEQRSTQGNWFNRPFAEVIFDGDPTVATAVYLQESLTAPKDIAWGQALRAQKDTLQSFGFNAEWNVTDRLTLEFDAHTAESESSPNGRNGISSYDFGTGAAAIAAHSLDIRSGFPVQRYEYDDSLLGNGNDHNGLIDLQDVSSSVGRTISQRQQHELDEFRFDVGYDLSDSIRLDAGVDYRSSSMTQARVITAQILGDWGVTQPGDIAANAPGVLEAYCLSCLYDDYAPGDAEVAFRGNAADLYTAISPYYLGLGGHDIQTWNNDHNVVDEDITAYYAQVAWSGELGGHEASLVAGVRYEETDVVAATEQAVPQAVVWNADNDFSLQFGSGTQPLSADASYDNTLPSLDFRIELMDDVVARASYSKTIARADYSNLFVADSAGTPPRATALGGIAGGSSGNTGLVPLESENFDISLEAYYDDASYISIGLFNKEVSNFIGIGSTSRNLFGLRDVSSGAPGSRSGQASDALAGISGALRNDVNMFVMTALIDQFGVTEATNRFLSNSTNGVLDQTYADQVFALYDILPNSSDPLFEFRVTQPLNQQQANIHGVEFAIQHFFGDTGFGVQANYTLVDGDVAINTAGDPGVNQFALLGLSDTANATLIYENHGVSARLAYNWRDEYLTQVNRGGYRNPTFVDAFTQIDLNVSYDLTPNLVLSFEGINLTGENIRQFGRTPVEYWFIQELDPRYLFGARYKF